MAVRFKNENNENLEQPENKLNNFINQVKNTFTHQNYYHMFNFSYVKKLELNRKIIFLWLDIKGQVNYSFDLLEKEPHTTSLVKLGSVLSSFFGMSIEVVNNHDEINKKVADKTIKLNRAITDFQKHESFQQYLQINSNNDLNVIDVYENNLDNTYKMLPEIQNEFSMQQFPQENSYQKELYKNVIQLSFYQLNHANGTFYIRSNEIPVIYKEKFNPSIKEAFYYENGLLYRNTYFPTKYMIDWSLQQNIDNSFIFKFIFFMAKKDINKAMNILLWLVFSFNSLNKLPYILVLYSKENEYMNLFYEEVIAPLFNDEYCERIENTDLNKKTLSEKLDEKVIQNFHNITSSMILDEKTKELTRKLIYKDNHKLNYKNITTVANTLVTSTSNYIPLIANDVKSVVVDIESSIKVMCDEMGIKKDYYVVANLIKNDLQNFAQIVRNIDMSKFNNTYNLKPYSSRLFPDVLDGDTDLLKVFEISIKNKDLALFKSAIVNKDTQALFYELEEDFKKDRIYKQNLLDYYVMLFGKHYKNNPALIKALKNISMCKVKPFDSVKQFSIKGKVYYQI